MCVHALRYDNIVGRALCRYVECMLMGSNRRRRRIPKNVEDDAGGFRKKTKILQNVPV